MDMYAGEKNTPYAFGRPLSRGRSESAGCTIMQPPSLFLDYRRDGQAATACDVGLAILICVGKAKEW